MTVPDTTRIDKVIAETIRRRTAGESLSDDEVIAANPDLADLLAVKLHQLNRIALARQQAQSPDAHTAETTSFSASGSESANASDDTLAAGQQIRHYVLEERIGRGAFGTVWRAHDTKLHCPVAIKVPARGSLSRKDIDRFIREARMSAQLREHENVVTVHEADWDDETAFIVSALIDGESLGDRLEGPRIPFDEVVELIKLICGALHHAHEAGIIHRDLKPDNILLDRTNKPHVTDFGLARVETESDAAEAGRPLGTVPYMSPEQASGESDRADRRSDVFSLGIIFYELLTGERPFRGSINRILEQICNDDPIAPRTLHPQIPGDLETICQKCLEKDPDQRYQSTKEVADELLRFQRHEPIRAVPVSTVGRLWRWSKRNPSIPWLSLALIAVTLASTVVGAVLLNREVKELQAKSESHARDSLELAAVLAAEDAQNKFTDRFAQVTNLVAQPILRNELIRWNRDLDEGLRDSCLSDLRSQQSTPELKTMQELLDSFLKAEQQKLKADAAKMHPDATAGDSRTFSWFVCDAEGYQIARSPPKSTMGKQFNWRSYFTGANADRPRDNPGNPVWKNGPTAPKLSASFITDKQDAWVLAISVPIYDPDTSSFEGVAGIFIQLEDLVAISFPEQEGDRFMSIYDVRNKKSPVPIRHPYYEQLTANNKDIPGKTAAVDLAPLSQDLPFKDPFYQEVDYRGVARPIQLEDETSLLVVVQERSDLTTEPVRKLGANLAFLGISLVGLAAAILFPIWALILRRVVN